MVYGNILIFNKILFKQFILYFITVFVLYLYSRDSATIYNILSATQICGTV
jgi:hypothetical protein